MATSEAQVRKHLEPEEPNYAAAAAALGADALPVLMALVQGDDALLASKAAYLAALLNDQSAGSVLEAAARSPHRTVRVAAAAGLQKRPEISDEVAAELMTDRDPGVRKVATKATRSRMTPGLRDRIASRESQDTRTAAESYEDGFGGGPSPGPSGAESSAGEGGGDLGEAGVRSPYAAFDDDADGGGGGDLGAGVEARAGGSDGPDGGGSFT
jgi:hypothetical protein